MNLAQAMLLFLLISYLFSVLTLGIINLALPFTWQGWFMLLMPMMNFCQLTIYLEWLFCPGMTNSTTFIVDADRRNYRNRQFQLEMAALVKAQEKRRKETETYVGT